VAGVEIKRKLGQSASIALTIGLLSGCTATVDADQALKNDELQEVPAQETPYFSGPCETDPNLDEEWLAYQEIFSDLDMCTGPYRLVPATMPNTFPTSAISPKSDLRNYEECRIVNDPETEHVRAFANVNQGWMKDELHPSPNTIYQVVPIFSSDAPHTSGKSPSEEYGKYFDFITTWSEYVSDGESNVEFRVPEEYLEFPEEIKKFEVGHKNWDDPGHQAFAAVLSEVIKGKIDIDSANMILIVVPAGTDLSVVEKGPVPIQQNGRQHPNSTILSPALTAENADSRFNLWLSHPIGVLHELYHIGPGLEDHHGDWEFDTYGAPQGEHLGTGQWGLMSSGISDLLGWEKWFLGFTLDKQVRCAPTTSTTTHWLAPSSIKTNNAKLLVVPIGKYEALVVESIRAKGLNYKIPMQSEGALVYFINTSEPRRNYAYQVLRSADRPVTREPFRLADWTLKSGESLTFKGIKIEVVESGEFGDVVSVSKP
jgi:hypothetical protein